MKSMLDRKKLLNTLWTMTLCAVCFGIGFVTNMHINSDARLVQKAKNIILSESLYNKQSSKDLSYAAIRGMLSGIDDPFAELIEPDAAQDLIHAFTGNTGIVGIYAENQGGQVVIFGLSPGGPAEKSGIKVGDVLLSIDGKPLDEDVDSSETGLLIRGLPGTTVLLEVLRDGETLEFSVLRQEQEFVSYRMLPEDIAYVYLSAFNKNASQRLKETLEGLLEQEPVGLIWDLRNNEGGDMQATQEILSYFIEDGLLFAAEQTKGRTVEFFAEGNAFAANIPLVVLMDRSTYSAAETAAIAVADLGRGTTVGSVSYGKGLIQATMPLMDGNMLQMTIAKWLSAGGEWYHERGVPAQVEVHDDPATEADELIQKAIELLLVNP